MSHPLDMNFIAGARKWWVLLSCPACGWDDWYTYAGHDPEECRKQGQYEPILCGKCLQPVKVDVGTEIIHNSTLKLGRYGFG